MFFRVTRTDASGERELSRWCNGEAAHRAIIKAGIAAETEFPGCEIVRERIEKGGKAWGLLALVCLPDGTNPVTFRSELFHGSPSVEFTS